MISVDKWPELEVRALYDGDEAKDMEPVMTIEGDPDISRISKPYCWVLLREPPQRDCRQVRREGRQRQGDTLLQRAIRSILDSGNGRIRGAQGRGLGVSTDANADYWGVESMGTIPHALIAVYKGDTAEAAMAFDRYIESGVNR